MPGIFISYRRDDSAPWAGRVYERLAREFERDNIFMDVDNIAPGLDFVEELGRQVGSCDALVAVMGKGWSDARNSKGLRRLDDPTDFVRIELEQALARGLRVIPVLVDGASMPSAEELPEPLRPLSRRNAVELSHARFGSDAQRLVDALAPIIARPAKMPEPDQTSDLPTRARQIARVLAWIIAIVVTVWSFIFAAVGLIVVATEPISDKSRIVAWVLVAILVAALWVAYFVRRKPARTT